MVSNARSKIRDVFLSGFIVPILICFIYLAVRFCEFNFGHKAVIMKIQFTKIDLSNYNLTISYLKKFILCDKLSFTALTGENLITLVTIISTEYTYHITLFKIFINKVIR